MGGVKDRGRAKRYFVLANALYFNRDLKFPNLDQVLPLPPAPLPQWDGNKDALIDAAKAVPLPSTPPEPTASAASQRTGRPHIPED